MALPEYAVRSYAGGAVAAQLVNDIGASDASFTVTTTAGWTESAGANVGQPLGTSGAFEVVIDRFTDTVEKILCSAVNLSTGVVTVWTSGGSGRGYDGSTAQAHVPNGSTSGVQVTWAAAEAFEANAAVAYLLGTAGGTRTPSTVLTLDSGGNPKWVAPAAGVAAHAQITTGVSGITGPTVISGLSVTIAVTAGQTLKLTAFTPQFASAGGGLATDQYSIGIFESSTQLGTGLAVSGNEAVAYAVLTPSAGSHTYSVQGNHVTGSNAGDLGASTTSPAFLLAEVI